MLALGVALLEEEKRRGWGGEWHNRDGSPNTFIFVGVSDSNSIPYDHCYKIITQISLLLQLTLTKKMLVKKHSFYLIVYDFIISKTYHS